MISAALGPAIGGEAKEFPVRRGFTSAEGPPPSPTSCEALGATLSDVPAPTTRVDLWITGKLTLAHTDGALWYLAVCSSPGIRVMCVTYEGNGMKVGDVVTLSGGYNRQDPRHVVLDPCLAVRS